MCYAKPGPRCSYHARKTLVNAKRKLDLVKNLPSTPKNQERKKKALDNLNERREEYFLTPAGITQLENNLLLAQENNSSPEIIIASQEKIRSAKTKRDEQFAAYYKIMNRKPRPARAGVSEPRRYSSAESGIRNLFITGKSFEYQGSEYRIEAVGKPLVLGAGGEPKTDVFVRTNSNGKISDFKISYKGSNAEFAENKISQERAEIILGEEYKNIISFAADKLGISQRELITSHGNAFSLGVRLDIMSEPSQSYAKVTLPHQKVVDIYAGTNLDTDKKNSRIPGINNGESVENSGVADYILIGDDFNSAQQVIDSMVSIEEYAKENPHIYLAFKNLNYRVDKKKWDGNRPLVYTTNWENNDGIMQGSLDTDHIFANSGNASGEAFLKVYSVKK